MKKSIILYFALLCSFSVSSQIPQIQWQKSLGGTYNDQANSIIQTLDSGFVVAGFSESNDGDVTGNHASKDFWVVKLNASGTIEWQKSLGGTNIDLAASIIKTSDNGYVVAGYSRSNDGDVTGNHGNFDYWVVKLNSLGTIEWQKSLGGTDDEGASSIIQTSDSGYIVAGESISNDGDVTGNHGAADYWVVKLNSLGILEWQKSLGGTDDEEAYSIIQTSDSGYIVAGYSLSNDGDVTNNHGSGDYWVVKLNGIGIIDWQKCLGGTNDDEASSIIQTNSSQYVVAGGSNSNNGDVTGNHGQGDCWVVKLNPITGTENLFTSNAIHVYPNPSTNTFSISANSEFDNTQLNIFNAMGLNVYSCHLSRETKVVYTENFPTGVYYLQVFKGERMWGQKIIKE